jgi:integral membrane protein
VSAALARLRAMAYVVGTLLIVLVLVGVPLQYAAGRPGVVAVVGPIHGVCYLVYLVVGYDVTRRARLGLGYLLAIAASGLLPFLAFFVERWVRARALAGLGAPSAPEGAVPRR